MVCPEGQRSLDANQNETVNVDGRRIISVAFEKVIEACVRLESHYEIAGDLYIFRSLEV